MFGRSGDDFFGGVSGFFCPDRKMRSMRDDTLSDAIRAILIERPNCAASSREIAEEIGSRELWRRNCDEAPVEAWQIELRARTQSGRGWFQEVDGIIRLTKTGIGGSHPQ